jgi:hypothetical protein
MTSKRCLNCDSQLSGEAKFCPNCGQSRKLGKLSVWEIFKDILGNIFNIDAKVWKSLLNLLVPAKLTKVFVEGKRIDYLTPARIFLFFLLTLLASIAFLFNNIEDYLPGNLGVRSSEQFIIAKKLDSLIYDRLEITDTLKVDSLKKDLFDESVINDNKKLSAGNITIMQEVLNDYKVEKEDIARLDAEYIIDKYEVKSFWDKLRVRQSIRIYKDLTGVIRYTIGNIFWMIVLMVFVSSIFLKLLYIRNRIYLTEHLILSTYIHTFSLFIYTIGIGIITIYLKLNDGFKDPENLELIGLAYLIIPCLLYAFLSLKKYYQQGWIKTFIKFIIILLLYSFAVILTFAIVIVISLFLY